MTKTKPDLEALFMEAKELAVKLDKNSNVYCGYDSEQNCWEAYANIGHVDDFESFNWQEDSPTEALASLVEELQEKVDEQSKAKSRPSKGKNKS